MCRAGRLGNSAVLEAQAMLYELDAMPPPQLRNRVTEQIRSRLNLPLWNHAKMIEAAQLESMEAYYDGWKTAQDETDDPKK